MGIIRAFAGRRRALPCGGLKSNLTGSSAMCIRMGVVVASIAAALCCGYIARGQNREKKIDETVKKGAVAATNAQSAAKSADTAKQPADAVKPAASKSNSSAASESPDAKAIKASAE